MLELEQENKIYRDRSMNLCHDLYAAEEKISCTSTTVARLFEKVDLLTAKVEGRGLIEEFDESLVGGPLESEEGEVFLGQHSLGVSLSDSDIDAAESVMREWVNFDED